MSVKDSDSLHRMDCCNSKDKHRPIIFKFICYKGNREILNKKKRRKGAGVSITESLTTEKMLRLKISIKINLASIMCGKLM